MRLSLTNFSASWTIINSIWYHVSYKCRFQTIILIIPPPNEVGGGYTGFTLSVRPSVCPSVRPSVCRRHGFHTPAQRSWRGVYWIHLVRPSVCPSVRPSVCRRHGFRSISQVCFWISISNFICMLMVAIGRSLLIFRVITFKMAAWRPYWIFWFQNSNFSLALNINFKLQRHNTYIYG